MMDYPQFRPTDEQLSALLSEQTMGRLVTVDDAGWPRVGLHVYVNDGLTVETHLVKGDPHLDDIRANGRALFEIDDVLSTAPSHWIDDENAAHADQFYRCVVLRGPVEIIPDPSVVAAHLRELLRRRQPEGRYVEVTAGHPMYDGQLKRLAVVRIHATVGMAKFKLGQRTKPETRDRIVAQLRARAAGADERTARLIEAS